MSLEIARSLGTISSWLADKATSLDYGLIQIEIQIRDNKIYRIDKMTKETHMT